MFSPEFAILFTGRAIANGILQMIWNLRTIKTYSVYFGRDESGIIRYVGITKRDPLIRFKEHLNPDGLTSTLRFKEIKGKYSYREARRLEQMYINKYRLQKHGGQLYNKINSIAPKRWDEYGITP